MQTQTYAIVGEEEARRLIEEWGKPTNGDDERAQLMRTLGFVNRIDHENTQAHRVRNLRAARVVYPEMTGSTLRTWRRFLPTTETPRDYTFDAIPTEALEQIRLARTFACFDEIQIWTPIGNGFMALVAGRFQRARQWVAEMTSQLDPMAVGVVTDEFGVKHFFQIVRWGEALRSFSDIKWHVRGVRTAFNLMFVVLPLATVLLVFGGCIAAATRESGFWGGMFPTTLFAFFVLGMLCLLIKSVGFKVKYRILGRASQEENP